MKWLRVYQLNGERFYMTKYRKIATIEAEQFDESDEMVKKYNLHYAFRSWQIDKAYRSLDGDINHHDKGGRYERQTWGVPLGWWIVTFRGDYYVVCDEGFRKTYEKVE